MPVHKSSYAAFISYRHLCPDSAVAGALYSYLCSFELPLDLKLKYNCPRSIGSIYFDDDCLKIGEELKPALREALRLSNNFVLICSRRTLEENDEKMLWQKIEYDAYVESHADYCQYGRVKPLKIDDECRDGWLNERDIFGRKYVDYQCTDCSFWNVLGRYRQRRIRQKAFNGIAAAILEIPENELYRVCQKITFASSFRRWLRRLLICIAGVFFAILAGLFIREQYPGDALRLLSHGIYPDYLLKYEQCVKKVIMEDDHAVLESWWRLCGEGRARYILSKKDAAGNYMAAVAGLEDKTVALDFICAKLGSEKVGEQVRGIMFSTRVEYFLINKGALSGDMEQSGDMESFGGKERPKQMTEKIREVSNRKDVRPGDTE